MGSFMGVSEAVEEMVQLTKEKFGENSGLDEKWKQLVSKLLNENDKTREAVLEEFEAEIAACKELAELTDNDILTDRQFLIRYLRGANWNVKTALNLFTSSFTQVKDYFPFMSAGIPSELERVWEQELFAIPEDRDQHARRVFVFRLGQWDPAVSSSQELFTAAFTLFELLALEEKTQIAGITIVLDVSGFGFQHLKYLGINELRCLCNFLTGAFPIWMRRIHIVNNPRIFNMFINLCKPFVNERVRENIVMHSYDLQSLHGEVSPSFLPKYLGGDQDKEMYKCVEKAKQLDSHFLKNIENARQIYAQSTGED